MSEEIEKHILEKFEIQQKLGRGAYGVVWKARDKRTGELVALKKVYDAFQNSTDAQRTYREVLYLRHLSDHPNIVNLKTTFRALNNKDLYMVFDLMETDLHIVIRAHILKDVHKQFIIYQLFKSLKYIHSADLIHRDLKPSNMLINSDCLMKLADFGLARSIQDTEDGPPIVSDYIATRWYRAPEILLGSQEYSKSVDIWSAGCIFAELMLEKVLFAGKSSLNQIELIIELLGRPSNSEIKNMRVGYQNNFLSTIKTGKTRSFNSLFKKIDSHAFDLLKKILIFNPDKRPSVEQVLAHPYFHSFHNPSEEPFCRFKAVLPISDNDKQSVKIYRDQIYSMCQKEHMKSSIRILEKKKSLYPTSKPSPLIVNNKVLKKSELIKSVLTKKKSIGQKEKISSIKNKKSIPEVILKHKQSFLSRPSKENISRPSSGKLNVYARRKSRDELESKKNGLTVSGGLFGKKTSLAIISRDPNSTSYKFSSKKSLNDPKKTKLGYMSKKMSETALLKQNNRSPLPRTETLKSSQLSKNRESTSKMSPYFLLKNKLK